VVLMAVEGWGKTSCGAYAPGAGIMMAGNETGYVTLAAGGRVPTIPHVNVTSWSEVLGTIDGLIENTEGIKLLVLDALLGFERACHEHVCQREYKGDWGERGFTAFQRGYEVALDDWLEMLARLDVLNKKGVGILLLSHARVSPFRNPLGPDIDQYQPDCHAKTWGQTAKWCDAVLCGVFRAVPVDSKAKADDRTKGIGAAIREVHCERRDGVVAKNRYGMPPVISIPNDPRQIWTTIVGAMKGATVA